MSKPPVVLITGCTTGGIGYSLCEEFHAKGCLVYASARRVESVEGLHPSVRILQLDVTLDTSIKAAVNKIIEERGRIDILVNNAGLAIPGPLAEVDLAEAQKVFDANFWGTLRLVQEVSPHMIKNGKGKIINIGSVAGYISTPFGGIYCASKAAIHSVTDSLRVELKPYNVDVMLVAPGGIKSRFGATSLKMTSTNLKIYKPFQEAITARAEMSQTPKSTPANVFAQKLVRQVLRPRLSRVFFYGYMSSFFKLLMWTPLWFRDMLMARKFGLNCKIDGTKLTL